MKLIEASHNACAGCRLCEMVCSLYHEGECGTSKSRVRIFRDEEFGNNLVSVCLQCEEAHCLQSCALDAISRDAETGVVRIDSNLCNGCEACLAVCPVNAVFFDPKKEAAFKCDLCGGDPECVKFCSRGAITLKDTDVASPQRKMFLDETHKLLARFNA